MKPPAPTAVVMPIKSFRLAKGRLAEVLDPAEREHLARSGAARVALAAAGCSLFVVCTDDDVAAWAASIGAQVVQPLEGGLNAAAQAGRAAAAESGARRVIVVHSDLPMAEALSPLAALPDDVVIVPDRHHDGTNAMVVPAEGSFTFCYGAGSAALHEAEATRRGFSCSIVQRPDLALDLDTPDDLLVWRTLRQPQK